MNVKTTPKGNAIDFGTVEAFKQELAERTAKGEQCAITIGDDGNARIVNISQVNELREIRTANVRDINAILKPMPLVARKVGANRNLPCPCGSGRKFKKCCFFLDNPIAIEP